MARSPSKQRLSSSDMSSLLADRGPIHVHVGKGLRGGRRACISKTHHALVHGVAAVDVFSHEQSGFKGSWVKDPDGNILGLTQILWS